MSIHPHSCTPPGGVSGGVVGGIQLTCGDGAGLGLAVDEGAGVGVGAGVALARAGTAASADVLNPATAMRARRKQMR
ncbi:hypothetical protein ABZ897_44900 [Nonomuraea sp. NPDC046802]|uniref:hypothetical protein n=1 Tax=Nonomuraea sp. NPDC046802 TaxID=3154919 RepID=UPI0033E08048